ncbi:hypothetical protein EV368DRAFT_83012 [Lentinula lateritia]|uniref:Uncharacterized protein n=1 Tax=Lentinula aff. lateritia TaxID=2804960 RepID=A0ACC1TPY1_9AGAR|nr:hypothetical protein F5876DRAFT_80325 [Lentinula aff. lateritia]KAJ3851960.1 hypothetical protein EV368DRAFT_83012 [Lentinula lateritia]
MTSSFPCPLLSSSDILVDDADPRIVYSSGWIVGGRTGLECEATTHGSNNTMNSTAIFTFEGVGVEVFGTIGVISATSFASNYQIDNLPNSQSIFATNGQINFRVPFYKSPSLEAGNHTLTITVPPGDTSSSLLYLDYIIYHPIPTSTISCPAATIIGSTYSALSTCTAGCVGITSHSPSAPAIAGGVIGSIMGVVVGIALAFVLRPKTKNRAWCCDTSTQHREPLNSGRNDSQERSFQLRNLNAPAEHASIYNVNLDLGMHFEHTRVSQWQGGRDSEHLSNPPSYHG